MTIRTTLAGTLLATAVACDDHVLGVVDGPTTAYSCDVAGLAQFLDEQQCTLCHYVGGPGGFDVLATIETQLGDDNPDNDILVVPGDPDASRLWLSLTWEDPLVPAMPQTASEPLPASQIEHIRCWIEADAPLD